MHREASIPKVMPAASCATGTSSCTGTDIVRICFCFSVKTCHLLCCKPGAAVGLGPTGKFGSADRWAVGLQQQRLRAIQSWSSGCNLQILICFHCCLHCLASILQNLENEGRRLTPSCFKTEKQGTTPRPASAAGKADSDH